MNLAGIILIGTISVLLTFLLGIIAFEKGTDSEGKSFTWPTSYRGVFYAWVAATLVYNFVIINAVYRIF